MTEIRITPDEVADYSKNLKRHKEDIEQLIAFISRDTTNLSDSFGGVYYDSWHEQIQFQKVNLNKVLDLMEEAIKILDKGVDKGQDMRSIFKEFGR